MPGQILSTNSRQKAHTGLFASFTWLRRGWSLALEAIFPPRCAGCDRVGYYLCARCVGEIEALPLFAHAQARPPLAVVAATAPHEGKLQQAIWSLKYENMPQVATPLGRRLAQRVGSLKWNIDMIVPVPLHTTRLRERGYNQSQLLGTHAAMMLGIPCCPDALKRTRQTTSQVTLTAEERLMNMQDAFLAEPHLVSQQNILLVDDVYTTGATLAACAQALLDAGAAAVYGLTVTSARG